MLCLLTVKSVLMRPGACPSKHFNDLWGNPLSGMFELYIYRYLQLSHILFIYLFFGAGQEELRLKDA